MFGLIYLQPKEVSESKIGETFFVEACKVTEDDVENSGAAVTFIENVDPEDLHKTECNKTDLVEKSVHNETTTKEPELKIDFSLNLSELDLSLSPDGKGIKINVQNLSPSASKPTTKSDVVVDNADQRRFSSGTYVTSPSFANLRDISSPQCDAIAAAVTCLEAVQEDASMEMSGIVAFTEPSILSRKPSFSPLDLADESQDDISLLVNILLV